MGGAANSLRQSPINPWLAFVFHYRLDTPIRKSLRCILSLRVDIPGLRPAEKHAPTLASTPARKWSSSTSTKNRYALMPLSVALSAE